MIKATLPFSPLAFMLALTALLAVNAWAIPGDVNADGAVTDADIALAEDHLLGKTPLSSAAQARADINLNSLIDVGDLVGLAKLKTNAICLVPSVLWESAQRAQTLLSQAGLSLGQTRQLKSDSAIGTVVGQVPGPGAGAAPGSAVDLTVSAGTAGGAYLEISPTTVELGTAGTQATFEVRCIGEPIAWTAGMWADYTATPASGTGNAQVTLTLDRTRLPFGKGSLTFAVVPENSSASGAYATVKFDQTVYPPPTAETVRSHVPCAPGDTISIGGDYYAQNASDNLVDVNGVAVSADSVHFSPPTLTFRIPQTTKLGMAEIRVRRASDATLGASPWGRALVTRIVAPTDLVLASAPDGQQLWVEPSWQVLGSGMTEYAIAERAVGAADWVLSGRNFSRVNGANVNTIADPPTIGGTTQKEMAAEAEILGQRYFIPARALGDDRVIVRPRLVMNNAETFKAALQPGRAFRMRLWGSEKGTFFPRASNWVDVTVSPVAPAIGSVIPMDAKSLKTSSWNEWTAATVLQVARGSHLVLLRDVYDSMTLRAPGLWDGDSIFTGQSDYASPGYVARHVALTTPGLYTITNLTTGAVRKVEVLDGGAPYESYVGNDYARLPSSAVNVVVPPDKAMTIEVCGARVSIPAGALPTAAGQLNLATFSYHRVYQGSYELSDPEADDGRERFDLSFMRTAASGTQAPTAWEPDELLKPITIEAYYSPQAALNGPPSLAVLDETSGIYWDLPCTVDAGQRKLTLVLPAAHYAAPGAAAEPGRLASDVPSGEPSQEPASATGFPAVGLYQITRHMGIPYLKSARSTIHDDNNWFVVDYISDAASSSYVSDTYASGVLDTLVDAYENLKGDTWKEPGGTTFIYLRKTLLGGYGSSTKGVFGRPTITINITQCPEGSAAYYSTPAHEVGHIFQRNYTTNIIAKWFDEAAAEWVALDSVGSGSFLTDNLNDALPFIKSLPGGFTFGYSTAEGYAASPWPVWLDAHYAGSIRKVYEALDGDPLNWERHQGVVADVTGQPISNLYLAFARDYWLQSFAPLHSVDLHGQAQSAGLNVGLTMTESGDLTLGNVRPALSSLRLSVEPTAACLAKFAGRSAVMRFAPGPEDLLYEVSVFGDRAGAANIPNEPQAVTTFTPSGPTHFVVGNLGQHRSYRFILANGSALRTFSPTIRIVFPTVTGLSPASGARAGGYTVTVTGNGFGATPGQIAMSGTDVPIVSWSDTQVRFTMPKVGDSTASWDLVVRTAESVATNSRTFTFTN